MLAAFLWGSSYLVVKDILTALSPAQYLSIRFAISLPIVALVFHRQLRAWIHSNRTEVKASRDARLFRLLVPGAFLGLAFILQSYGLQTSSPSVAAFLTSLFFIFVPLLELAAGETAHLKRLILPIALAAAGVASLTRPWTGVFRAGDLLLVFCAASFAAQIFFVGRVRVPCHYSVLFIFQGIVVLAASLVLLAFTRGTTVSLTGSDWLRILYIVFVVTILCYSLQFWAQRVVRPRYVALILAAEPVFALTMSVAMGYDTVTVLLLIGSLSILIAVLIAVLLSTRDRMTAIPTASAHESDPRPW